MEKTANVKFTAIFWIYPPEADQSGPILSALFGGTLRFKDVRYRLIPVLFFPFASDHITILFIISDHPMVAALPTKRGRQH